MGSTCLPGAAAGRAAGPAAPPGRFVPELTGARRAAAALRPGGMLPHRHLAPHNMCAGIARVQTNERAGATDMKQMMHTH